MCRLVWVGSMVAALGCGSSDPVAFDGLKNAPGRLSDWGLFEGDGSTQEPVEGVLPYDLVSALFSDYALKLRFVRLPLGQSATYSATETFGFPVGTVIAKTFAYPGRLMETRLLVHQEAGWIGLPYVWNEAQNEAILKIAGSSLEASWIDVAGAQRQHSYLVPNANQCKGCHQVEEERTLPIGPKARYLNHAFEYSFGSRNQIAHWTATGALSGAPDPSAAPRVPVWNDPASGSVSERARTYLEINCAHCHNPGGPGRTTGLDLRVGERSDKDLGIFKFPIAAGRGTGDRSYGVVPGHPDASIFVFRVESVDPGIMMPELGRQLVHQEGVALIRRWIEEMDPREGLAEGAD